jgi:uracil-DNA glycosylase
LHALDESARASLAQAERHVAKSEKEGMRVYPPAASRYRALELVAPGEVRVVILGQDPYHGPGQAMGLAFSVPREIRVPPSLANVYKELAADLAIPRPAHGDLTAWARQGVLLLNTSLSVEEGKAGSHAAIGWSAVTDSLIATASREAKAAVFMLWGAHARAKAPLIDRSRHLVLESAHPSPLSARKFLGCRHFSRANDFLRAHGTVPVQWALN